MQQWKFEKLELDGAYKITPFCATDDRGGLIKDYSKEIFEKNGIAYDLKEVFYTVSKKGTIRAVHFQLVKQQPKLVRCVSGRVYDVIVDLRVDSPTFGKWLGFDLTGDNMTTLLVPSCFGHGYLVLEDSIVSYKCAECFYAQGDSGIMWNDPAIGIVWPLAEIGGEENLIISDKDKQLMRFEEYVQQITGK